METAVKSCSEDSCLAFDLLNADDPSASDCPLTPRSRRRPISKSFDSDTLEVQRASLPPIRQRLLRSIHHELSLLAAEADGVSEKVKGIINKQRQRLDGLIEETSKAPRRLQSKIAAPLDKRRRQFHGKIRKAVTGDPSKSLRLHLEEKRSKPFMMRMMDKAAFTVGVLTMVVSEYVLLMMPERFWLWYSVMIPILLLMRYPDYRQRKWLFFYFDFCYFVQVCCIIAIFMMPHSCRLNKIIFIFSMGSLLWAVPLWRNSLVFHDVDKMTSCFIHLFPSWLALTLRWCPLDPMRGGTPGAEPECQEGFNAGDVGMATVVYLLWQVLYFIKTEVADKPKLDADPDIQTSLRWLTTSPKNPMHKIVLYLMRKCRLFKKDETFDPKTMKTKAIFMGSQMVFTVVVSLPTPLLYNSKWTSISLALIVFCCAIWNSSNYYIEVFSRRYWQSMEAEAAAKAEALLLKAAKVKQREIARMAGERGEPRRALSAQYPSNGFDGVWTSGSMGDSALSEDDDDEDDDDKIGESPVEDGEEEEDAQEEAGAEGPVDGGVESNGGTNPIEDKSKDV